MQKTKEWEKSTEHPQQYLLASEYLTAPNIDFQFKHHDPKVTKKVIEIKDKESGPDSNHRAA